MKLTRRTVLTASAATPAAPAVKASPGWPTKQPIKLMATFPPGGTADTISGILAGTCFSLMPASLDSSSPAS